MMLSPLSKSLLFSFLVIILNFSINNVDASVDESVPGHPRQHTWKEKGKDRIKKEANQEVPSETPVGNLLPPLIVDDKDTSQELAEEMQLPLVIDNYSSFQYLPTELCMQIFLHLDNLKDRVCLSNTSKYLHDIGKLFPLNYFPIIQLENREAFLKKASLKHIQDRPLILIKDFALSDSEINTLAHCIEESRVLKSFHLWNSSLSENHIDKLSYGLKLNSGITSLSLTNASIDNSGLERLFFFIKDSTTLTTLSLANNNIDYRGIRKLAEAIKGKKNFSLNVSYNSLADTGLSSFVDIVEYDSTSFIRLNLSHCNLTRNASEYIARLLKKKSVNSLNISDNDFDAGILSTIIRSLHEEEGILTNLNLEKNNIGSSGINIYHNLQDLTQNTTLSTLNLSNNNLRDTEANAIASMLKKNQGLVNLILSKNLITDEGAELIALGLKHNRKLSNLDLSGNNITSQGISEFIRIRREFNTTLTSLNLTVTFENAASIKQLQVLLRMDVPYSKQEEVNLLNKIALKLDVEKKEREEPTRKVLIKDAQKNERNKIMKQQYYLGKKLEKTDHSAAIQWYEKAATLGYVKAQYKLGKIHEEGKMIELNIKKAIEWYEKAATNTLGSEKMKIKFKDDPLRGPYYEVSYNK